MKKTILILLTAIGIAVTGCTENIRARKFGGTSVNYVPDGQKVVTVTWKEAQLWVLTKPMTTNDVAETYTFTEKSSFGLLEGKAIFHEKK